MSRTTHNSSVRWIDGSGPSKYYRVNSKYEKKPEDESKKERQRVKVRNIGSMVKSVDKMTALFIDDAGISQIKSNDLAGFNPESVVIERDRATHYNQLNDAHEMGYNHVTFINCELIDHFSTPRAYDLVDLDLMSSFGAKANNTGKRACDILEMVLINNKVNMMALRLNLALDMRVNGEVLSEVTDQIEQMFNNHGWKILTSEFDPKPYGRSHMYNRYYILERIVPLEAIVADLTSDDDEKIEEPIDAIVIDAIVIDLTSSEMDWSVQ